MMNAAFFRWLALGSYFGLMITLIVWIVVIPHGENFPIGAWLIIGVVPFLLPLRGILHAKPYTHAWASFLMLFYFTHGIGELYSSGFTDLFPWLEVVLSCTSFIGMILYIRQNAKNESKITDVEST
jgi:uncharacterized membrane protein